MKHIFNNPDTADLLLLVAAFLCLAIGASGLILGVLFGW